MKNNFIFYLTGAADSMSLARDFLARKELSTVIPFKLFYTPPYQRFYGIENYQLQSRYRPCRSDPHREAAVVLDLSEWRGHEQDDHLRCFLEYLHDAEGFYQPEFVITLGSADKEEIQKMYCLVSRYLGTGSVVEDRTLVDRGALSSWLKSAYPMEREAAECLAEVLLRKPIPSLDRVMTIAEDLMRRVDRKGTVTVRQLAQVVPGSKLELFCGFAEAAFRYRKMEVEG